MVVDVADALAVQIEERMVRKVYDCVAVACRGVDYFKGVVVGKAVCHIDGERCGIAFVAVGREKAEFYFRFVRRNDVPNFHIEAVETAVKRIFAVVYGQLIRLSSERKPALCDAVAETPDCRAKKTLALVVYVFVERFVPEHYIGKFAVPVADKEFDHARAEVCDRHFGAVFVFQNVKPDLFRIYLRVEIGWVEFAELFFPLHKKELNTF